MKVCLGGTFNVLHKGHKALIDKAIQAAGKKGKVFIGVAKGKLVQKKKFCIPFNIRVKKLRDYLEEKGDHKRVAIFPLVDKFGPAVYGEYDAIMASPESFQNAFDINRERKRLGKKQLKIIKIEFILAEDGKPISATRILNQEIDENGKSI